MAEEGLRGKLYEEEEFPLIGKKLAGIWEMIDIIGGGGMCQVYFARMDTHAFKAKKVINGEMAPKVLGLTQEEIGIDPNDITEITDSKIIDLINKRASGLSDRLERIILGSEEKDKEKGAITGRKRRDTRRVMQATQMQTTTVGFRAKENEVAVKILRSAQTKDADNVKRFINEAEAGKKFKHPHLIKSIDSGETTITVDDEKLEKVHHFVMEYVDPYDLEQHTEKDPLPTKFAVETLKGVLSACEYLHDNWTVHRDIKPSNILIDQDSAHAFLSNQSDTLDVRLGDLGLAKGNQTKKESSSSERRPLTKLTKEGLVIGTPHYMSPEQIDETSDIGSASDIWSISATMYALLTGHYPFADDIREGYGIFGRITDPNRSRPKSIREYNPNVSQTLDDLITINFINIKSKKKYVETTNSAGEKELVFNEIERDEFGQVIYKENNRLTATEFLLAVKDYEHIQENLHTDEVLETLIEHPKENLTLLHFEKLTRISRQKIKNTEEYDGKTIDKRIKILEKAIEYATIDATKAQTLDKEPTKNLRDRKKEAKEKILNKKDLTDEDKLALYIWEKQDRQSYLEKILIYEQSLPKYYEPEPKSVIAKKTLLSPLMKTVLISVLGLGTIGGGIYGGIEILGGIANTKVYETIKTDDATAREQLEQESFTEAIKTLNEIQNKRTNKLPSKYEDVDSIIGELEFDISKGLYVAADSALKQRKLREARKHANRAEEILEKSNAKNTEELSGQLSEIQKTLDKKDAAISILTLVETKYSGVSETYTNLEKEVSNRKPFPKIEEIENLKKNLDSYSSLLTSVVDDFLDEKNEKTQEFQDLETKLEKLLRKSNRLEFSISQEYLKEFQELTKQLKGNYFAEKSAEILKQAETLYQKTQQIDRVVNQTHLDSEKLDVYTAKSVEVKENLEKYATEINHFSSIREKAKQGNEAAKKVLELFPTKKYPQSCIGLGDAYSDLGEKTRAIQMYKTGIFLVFSGQLVEKEMLKNAFEKLKQLEQN